MKHGWQMQINFNRETRQTRERKISRLMGKSETAVTLLVIYFSAMM
jgi:hypothetical protein